MTRLRGLAIYGMSCESFSTTNMQMTRLRQSEDGTEGKKQNKAWFL